MKNILALFIAMLACTTAFCSGNPPSTGDKKRPAEKTCDTPAVKKQMAKNIAPAKTIDAPKPKKESDGIVVPLSWRPVLVY